MLQYILITITLYYKVVEYSVEQHTHHETSITDRQVVVTAPFGLVDEEPPQTSQGTFRQQGCLLVMGKYHVMIHT